jgi:GNAT superfamily N-acetyltransferase
MAFAWVRESPPLWDADKRRIVGDVPSSVFAFGPFRDGQVVPGDWWRAEDEGRVVGYGWMDHAWGDAEILLAVDASAQRGGAGTFILDRLEDEAADRGINYLYNVVPEAHPRRDWLDRWLQRRGFSASQEGGLLKRAVHHDKAPRAT